MEFEEFLPEDIKRDEDDELKEDVKTLERISQNQVYDMITSKQADWQTIIYDLISSEQLDPWDIDLVVLTKKYFEKIIEMEEDEYYISSKVLLAAALLLRIKSEILLNKHIRSIDEILFGKKENNEYKFERIEIDENEIPLLVPKTPISRMKKVTLNELMAALNHAINTESRRIRKEVAMVRAKKLSEVDFPTFKKIDLKDRIKGFYAKILTFMKKNATNDERHMNKVGYEKLIGSEREEKVSSFLPLLHLSNTKKLWLEQEQHLDEIYIYLYEYFDKNRDKFKDQFLEELAEDIESMKEELEGENVDEPEKIDKLKQARENKKKLAEQAKQELESELGLKYEVDNLDNDGK